MKTKRFFALSLLLHSLIVTMVVVLWSFPKEEKEKEIVLELSLATPEPVSEHQKIITPAKPAEQRLQPIKEAVAKSEVEAVGPESAPVVHDALAEIPDPAAVEQSNTPALKPVTLTPFPPQALQPVNVEEQYLDDHLTTIRDLLVKYRKYPNMAVRLKQEGNVRISFRLRHNGEVEDIVVLSSSGHEILDENAVSLIHKMAEHFPRPPKAVRITVPLNYSLKIRG